MENDVLRRLIETEETLRRQLDPLHSAVARLDELGGIHRLAAVHDRLSEFSRVASDPLEHLRLAGLADDGRLASIAEQALSISDHLAASYELPGLETTQRLLQEFEATAHLPVGLEAHQQASAVQQAMEAMRSPWLDVNDRLGSLTSFAELQGIGRSLRSAPAFDEEVSEGLRRDLGDWRSPLAWSQDIFIDPLARTALYEAQGLDVGLTSFPAPAFRESLALAGLLVPPPPEVDGYGPPAELFERVDEQEEDDEEEEAFRRTNEAHARLTRFEMHIRRFIDLRMTSAYGRNWIRQRVPAAVREQWEAKKDKATKAGEPPYPLIAYADFTDYLDIITRKDHWRDVFQPFFQRETSVRESFQRLYPIRICTMHARLITQDDELYLLVETKRLLSAIEPG